MSRHSHKADKAPHGASQGGASQERPEHAPAAPHEPQTAPEPSGQGSCQAPGEAALADPLQALQAERDDLLSRLQRVSADYVNYQKRVQREIAQAREFANETLIKELLVVLDDMERALKAGAANHAEDDPLLKGMELAYDKAVRTLGGFGLSAIEAAGKPFDPDRHSAVTVQPSNDHPPRTVLAQLQKGYQLKGRVIRPSAVVVSKAPEKEEDKPDAPRAPGDSGVNRGGP